MNSPEYGSSDAVVDLDITDGMNRGMKRLHTRLDKHSGTALSQARRLQPWVRATLRYRSCLMVYYPITQ